MAVHAPDVLFTGRRQNMYKKFDRVIIKETQVKGFIDGIDTVADMVRVVYWENNVRKTIWLYEIEIEKGEEA